MQDGFRRFVRGGVWGGGTPSHWERGLGRGLCFLPENKVEFFSLEMACFGAF